MRRLQNALRMMLKSGLAHTFGVILYQISYKRFEQKRQSLHSHSQPYYDCPTVDLHGLNMHLLPTLEGLSEMLVLYGTHEPLSTSVFKGSLAKGEHIIDIGSNIGYYPLLALSIIRETGRILCFEPIKENFKILVKNLTPYNCAKAFPYAVSDNTGQIQFYKSKFPNWSSVINHEHLNLEQVIQTRAVTLDDFLSQFGDFQPTLIRMDIEGGEVQAFEGLWKTIHCYKPKMFIEFHPHHVGFGPIISLLTKLNHIAYEDVIFVNRQWDEPWLPSWVQKGKTENLTLAQIIEHLKDGKIHAPFSLFFNEP